MINYIYEPFNAWYVFASKYYNINLGLKAYLDIKQRLLIDKYLLTMKKCEDILNDKDDIKRLHSIMYADSLILVGDIIFDKYVESLSNPELRSTVTEYLKKEIDRINSFMKIIYTDYNTLSKKELNMIIKEYK